MATVFEDLTAYRHMIEPFRFEDVFNIGWVDPCGQFSTGGVSGPLHEKLLNLAFGKWAARILVEPSRALPECPACGPVRIERDGNVLMDAELWIPGEGRFYASPVLVLHHIEAHGYRPPAEYLAAVERLKPDTVFDGEALYRDKLKESGWFANQFK